MTAALPEPLVRRDRPADRHRARADQPQAADSGVTVNWGSAADSPLKAQIVTALLKDGKPRATIDVSSPNNPAVR